jgi:Zn-dependent protease with chaperone function
MTAAAVLAHEQARLRGRHHLVLAAAATFLLAGPAAVAAIPV